MPKMLVEIIGENGSTKRKCSLQGKQILIKKGSKGRGNADYLADYTNASVIPYRRGFGPFKWLSQKVMLMEGADKCMSFYNVNGTPEYDLPRWDRAAEARLFEANVIKSSGNVTNTLKIPTMLTMFLAVGLVLQFLILLVATGRLTL